MLRIETVTRIVRSIVLAMSLLLAASSADAQDRLGGHFGVVLPLMTHVDGATTNVGDDFKLGFPMGITVKTSTPWAFDLELVPTLDPVEGGPINNVPLTIHPGVLRAFGGSWTGGLRMAFDIGNASWGFTPLLNKGFPMGRLTYFVEGVAPIRFQDDALGVTHKAISLGVHVGVGF
ncbi:MAG TPA: hypothetical protein VGF24_03020 [Vicinamibacterales bacterium]|jgi:hypothetical protein